MWCRNPLQKASLLIKPGLEPGSSLETQYTLRQNMITHPMKSAGEECGFDYNLIGLYLTNSLTVCFTSKSVKRVSVNTCCGSPYKLSHAGTSV